MTGPDWIAIDWGTTNLRAWGMLADGTVCTKAESGQGMGKLRPDEFEDVLVELVGGWIPGGRTVSIIACGMVGAGEGWINVPYRATPCAPVAPDCLVSPELCDNGFRVTVIPGLQTISPGPDVMRGEETQIAGLLAQQPGFDGIACLPGTHTKWVRIRSGRIVGFQTFMTGELFALLGQKSLLRHSISADGWSESAFSAAVDLGMNEPATIANRLFAIRAESLISGLHPVAARSRLIGLLIGAELASTHRLWIDGQLIVVGDGPALTAYSSAIRHVGKPFQVMDSNAAVLAGLTHTYRKLGATECPGG